MKLIKTADAVGHVLCHDITRIIPGVSKGAVFRKGHIVQKEDIPVLLSCGKENLYVWERTEGMLHEDEAAEILARICTHGADTMTASAPIEGKTEIRAATDALLTVNSTLLNRVNALGEISIATIHGGFPVTAGDRLAAARVIPLVIEKEKLDTAEKLCGEPLLCVRPFRKIRAGIVTTGSEVFHGRIKDAFGPVLKKKLAEYDADIIGQTIVPDKKELITDAILSFINGGADMVLCSGGMSVDPDDCTPGAIKEAGAEIVTYGAPVIPGAMFLLGYCGDIAVVGLPGCVMYAGRTIFDLILPRLIAGERLTADDITVYGEGGLCLSCEVCTFPHCGFGK
ncbi:MAG: molybdopterin-binding protein [Oscillospiraceae bacterium]|nr:molybdopterin-binding protein [Oscillospiraceae bacterium]